MCSSASGIEHAVRVMMIAIDAVIRVEEVATVMTITLKT